MSKLLYFLGVVFLVASFVYFLKPANALPTFFPGYSAALTKHHITHGIGVLILGLGCFVLAWFRGGKKSAK